MSSLSGLPGLKAVVTGGASGIGLATARALAARGAAVAVLDLDPDQLPAPLIGLWADVRDDAPYAPPSNRPPTGSAAWTSS